MKRWVFALLLLGCGGTVKEETTAEKVAPPNAEAVKLFVAGADQLENPSPQRLARAKELLQKAIAQAPNLWEAHYDLGLVERKLGRLDAARASFQKARELAKTAPEPILALAECELSRGEGKVALDLLQGFVASAPDDVEARLALSAVAREEGDLELALSSAREVLIRNPSETRALVEVGRVYRAQDERDVAELVLEKARAIDEKSAAVRNELGLLALDRGDTQLAFTHFAAARELDARYLPAHMNQGSVLLQAGDFDAAERAYRAALAIDPTSSDAAVGLAIALRGQTKHKEAKALYEKVLDADPANLAALYDLGVLETEFLDQRKQALGRFEKFLELAPKSDSHRASAERYVQDLKMASGSATP